ncbi:MAG: 2,3-bisphosphoglycerate-independent phosphoglycerate mutase [Planctomycetota bacterium]|nr:MAG: 2,3-bisphosphoglycerate-independent phosphoglycerate mutase [Planctomycetota bacterium]
MGAVEPTLLLVLDGWGQAPATDWNAITRAPAENFLRWTAEWPTALLSASGREVGLPRGLMGNSEVGHTNLGAGRVVFQTISRIDRAIEEGEFRLNGALRGAVQHALDHGSTLHLWGLIGDGGVHASDRHYRALLELAREMGLPGERLAFHALLDGRDTPPNAAPQHLAALEEMLAACGGRLATICGRYFGMDRDRRWDRTERFWRAMVLGRAEHEAAAAGAALAAARERGESDEFVQPTLIAGGRPVRDGDAVLCFNFRADRVRQLSEAFLAEDFAGFDRVRRPRVHYVTMTRYRDDFACPVAFPPEELRAMFGELVAAAGRRQFRCAETEKYAHVTFFFNGGREDPYPGEERLLVPSPKVATYDLQPEMSAPEVCDQVCRRLERGQHDLYVVNFANSDMVGHTGIQAAAEAAVRAVDACLGRIVAAALARGGTVAITADHGNSEQMRDPTTGEPHTAHTLNPVPFLLLGERFRGARLRPHGVLADVAPTLLETMGLAQPTEMDGRSLLAG